MISDPSGTPPRGEPVQRSDGIAPSIMPAPAIVTHASSTPAIAAPVEYGGQPGADPTRYGDWEKNGRCIDF